MELTYLLLMGALSGLVGVLAHSVVYSVFELIRSRGTAGGTLQMTDAFLHLVCGAGLGLLFWLSWGLAGLVEVPWWARGATFAALCWLPISLPAVLNAWFSAQRALSPHPDRRTRCSCWRSPVSWGSATRCSSSGC